MSVKRAWIGEDGARAAQEGDPEMKAYLLKHSIPSYSHLTHLVNGEKNKVIDV